MEQYFYVARKENGTLLLFAEKPFKYGKTWFGNRCERMLLNKKLFQNVKWEDEEPLPVVLQQAIFKSKENEQ